MANLCLFSKNGFGEILGERHLNATNKHAAYGAKNHTASSFNVAENPKSPSMLETNWSNWDATQHVPKNIAR